MLLGDKQKEIALVRNILNTCLLISKHLKLYGAANKQIDLASSRLQDFFESYFLYHETLELTVGRHAFIYDEAFIEQTNNAITQFAYQLFQHGVSALTFEKDLAPKDIQTFLTLTGRPPSETWEEGGIVSSLRMRGVETIVVREMSENDLAYVNVIDPADRNQLLLEKSSLWDRFAFAVYRGLTTSVSGTEANDDNTSPGCLAELTNKILTRMSLASQQKFSKGLSNFLASLQFEKVNHYRHRALAKLTEFINRISPEIRERLFRHIFSLNMKPAFSEEFFSGLSDEIIIDMLEQSAKDNDFAPPVIMRVLGKIAQDKRLNIEHLADVDKNLAEKKSDLTKLFKKDDFEKYVPEEYRQSLLNIIQHDTISKPVSDNLLSLKTSLEETQQEKHTADIIIKILNESPDENYFRGLGENLVNIVYLYLNEGSFGALNDLYKLLDKQNTETGNFQRFKQVIASEECTKRVLEGVNAYGKSKFDEIEAFVHTVGTPFLAPLLEALATDVNRTNRYFYLKLLQQLEPSAVIALASKHLNDPRWYFVRNLISVLRNLKAREAMPYIQELSNHTHPKVRAEAMRACLQYGCNDAIEKLLQMLEGKDLQTIDTAVSLAAMVKHPEIFRRLVTLLRQKSTMNYRLSQKRAIVKTLAETFPKESLPVFLEILTSKNLLQQKMHEQLKDEIFDVMNRYDPPPASADTSGVYSKGERKPQKQTGKVATKNGVIAVQMTKLEMIQEIIRSLTSAAATASLYSPDHTRVLEHFARLVDMFRVYQSQESELLLARVEDELLFQGKPLARTPNVQKLLRYCTAQNVGFMSFSKGFTGNELQQLIKVLLGKASIESLQSMTSYIQVGGVDAPSEENVHAIASFEELPEEEKRGIQEQFDQVAQEDVLDARQISSLVAGFIEAFRQNINPFLALVPIRMMDEYTFTHSVNVGILNIAQGMALGIEGQMLHDIGIAGMLHDAGKIFVDREILNKTKKLDQDEFEIIKQHPHRGAQYLMNQEGIPKLAIFSAYEHHMRYDMKGYPKVPSGWQLNICSQMTMISDVFDALRTRRSYKNAWDFSKASGLLLSISGTQLNPDLTLNFLKMLAQMGEDIASFVEDDGDIETMDAIVGCSCSIENPRCG